MSLFKTIWTYWDNFTDKEQTKIKDDLTKKGFIKFVDQLFLSYTREFLEDYDLTDKLNYDIDSIIKVVKFMEYSKIIGIYDWSRPSYPVPIVYMFTNYNYWHRMVRFVEFNDRQFFNYLRFRVWLNMKKGVEHVWSPDNVGGLCVKNEILTVLDGN